MVMCSEPAMRAPLSGFFAAYSSRIAIKPGISVSAMRISLRPQSVSDRSATLQSVNVLLCGTALITRYLRLRKEFVSAVALDARDLLVAASTPRAWRAVKPVATLLEGRAF